MSDLEEVEREKREGLRVELPVPQDVLGLVIGKQGANISECTQGAEREIQPACL